MFVVRTSETSLAPGRPNMEKMLSEPVLRKLLVGMIPLVSLATNLAIIQCVVSLSAASAQVFGAAYRCRISGARSYGSRGDQIRLLLSARFGGNS